jgi:hypothetical protein
MRLAWTDTRPTISGFFWCKRTKYQETLIVKIIFNNENDYHILVPGSIECWQFEDFEKWSGPISRPTTVQKYGLAKALEQKKN